VLIELRDSELRVDEALTAVSHEGAGGIDIFIGKVRATNDGHAVATLVYSAYASMAIAEMTRIGIEIESELPGVRVAVLHRTGELHVGDIAVICAASAAHRGEAFTACRALIDRIKERTPIWKKEIGPDKEEWVGFRP
jgi:molybdopterin synthase catalytic subunit